MRIIVNVQLYADRNAPSVETVAASITDDEYRAAAIRAHAADASGVVRTVGEYATSRRGEMTSI